MPTQVVKPKKLFIPIIAILGMVLILTGLFNLTGMFNNDNTNSDDNPLILWAPEVQAQTVCTYYASPTGGGNGSSQSSPFQIADFWPQASPGDTLCLLDGKGNNSYTGSRSMITPPSSVNGTASGIITVRALNDGEVELDGQDSRIPVELFNNHYFTLEGFNAHNSDGRAVVYIHGGSSYIDVKRVVAWDAPNTNTEVIGAHYSEYILFEDCAAWGVGRKMFSNSQDGNHVIFRRCFGKWMYHTAGSPKCTFTSSYNSYYGLLENNIGTWDEEGVFDISEPYGIFRGGRSDYSKSTHERIYGNIAFILGDYDFQSPRIYFWSDQEDVDLRHNIAYIEGSKHSDVYTYYLSPSTSNGISGSNLTSIGGRGPYYSSCDIRNSYVAGDSSELRANGGSVLMPSRNGISGGAEICYRYQDGNLTNEPLWPWPMNQRIIDAMNRYYDLHPGVEREPVDVTATIEEIFGPIPAECKTGGGQPQPSITLTKSASPLSATPGQTITYTIHYQNTGQAAADTVVIKDVIPTGTQFVTGSITTSHSSADCSVAGGILSCTYPTIPVGAEGEIEFRVRVE